MKKQLLFLVISVMMLAAGCNQKNEEIAQLKAKNDSLTAVVYAKDTTVISFVNAFNEIQSNLDSIKMKEKIISKNAEGSSEIKTRTKDQINNDINLIYKLQLENRAKVSSLRSQLKKSGAHSAELNEMINNLTKQIEDKDVQIAQLKEDLAKVNVMVTDLTTNIENLNENNIQKQQVIDERTAELNTAYYVVGTTSYLKDKKIITKEGGFIGLGKSKELVPGVDMSNFTKIDITKLKAIPIMASHLTILTSHPKSSYRLTGKSSSDSLVITNQKEFWSLSKVLVVNVK